MHLQNELQHHAAHSERSLDADLRKSNAERTTRYANFSTRASAHAARARTSVCCPRTRRAAPRAARRSKRCRDFVFKICVQNELRHHAAHNEMLLCAARRNSQVTAQRDMRTPVRARRHVQRFAHALDARAHKRTARYVNLFSRTSARAALACTCAQCSRARRAVSHATR